MEYWYIGVLERILISSVTLKMYNYFRCLNNPNIELERRIPFGSSGGMKAVLIETACTARIVLPNDFHSPPFRNCLDLLKAYELYHRTD